MIDTERLIGWAAGAPGGASLTLGCGERLPPALSAAVTRLTECGVVAPVRKRLPDRQFAFVVQRGGAPLPDAGAAAMPGLNRSTGSPHRPARRRFGADRLVLAALRRDIRGSRPCRTNAELADDLDLPRSTVAWAIRQINASGVITFTHFGPLERRVITDVATGQSTTRAALPPRQRQRMAGGWLTRTGPRR